MRRRDGFTIAETLIALALLGVALTLVAQVGLWALTDRSRSADRQEATELAANLLESARATDWSDLTPAWAAGQKLSDDQSARCWRLEVRVTPEVGRPQVKRVLVRVTLRSQGDGADRTIELVGLFAARTAESKGDQS